MHALGWGSRTIDGWSAQHFTFLIARRNSTSCGQQGSRSQPGPAAALRRQPVLGADRRPVVRRSRGVTPGHVRLDAPAAPRGAPEHRPQVRSCGSCRRPSLRSRPRSPRRSRTRGPAAGRARARDPGAGPAPVRARAPPAERAAAANASAGAAGGGAGQAVVTDLFVTDPSAKRLACTGVQLTGVTIAAIVFLMAGIALVVIRRRQLRRRADRHGASGRPTRNRRRTARRIRSLRPRRPGGVARFPAPRPPPSAAPSATAARADGAGRRTRR